MYEPFSHPLPSPFGGRGWGIDTEMTQMWWYRQQLLRLTHMGLCGRLLNEWLINMYCRMEDQRFAVIRSEQTKRVARRNEICEVLANEGATTAGVGKKFYPPSFVPGTPRHLCRLRTDALELARRKGPPTFFITLTCSPYWKDILDELLPGENAADRPEVIVRVFRGRLEKLIAYLKDSFCGKRKYIIKVIEYQRRGRPHAHIVLSCEDAPTTADEVQRFISCEVHPEDGEIRDLVWGT